jgi:hypothetical protein
MGQHVVMTFLVNEGVKPTDIYRRLQAQHGDETLSHSKTCEWCKHFNDGCTSISDDPGHGGSQPTTVIPVNIQRVERLILDNRRLTCREIAQEINLSTGTVNTIIHEHFTTGYASIIQDQAFHALIVHRNDCCGLGTTMARIAATAPPPPPPPPTMMTTTTTTMTTTMTTTTMTMTTTPTIAATATIT